MTVVNKIKDFGDLFKSNITKIPESELNCEEVKKKIFKLQLGKPYITKKDIEEKQKKIFNYKFEI